MMPKTLRGMIIFVIVLFAIYLIMKIRFEMQKKKKNNGNRFRHKR